MLRGRAPRIAVGVAVLVLAIAYLAMVVEGEALGAAFRAIWSDPLALAAGGLADAAAFGLRTVAWRRVLPQLPAGQAWAALHVSLLGNHVLPLRLGEVLRVTSVLRRTAVAPAAAVASAVTLRAADLLAVVVLAVIAAPRLLGDLVSPAVVAGVVAVFALVAGAGITWLSRLRMTHDVRRPDLVTALLTVGAWLLESAVMWQAAQSAGIDLSPAEAVAVTAVTIVAQAVAVTPGGIGSYEAAATAALVLLGAPAPEALAAAVVAHAVKTAYSLLVGAVALVAPDPGYFGRTRLPATLPDRPPPARVGPDAPVVVFLPAHDEEAVIGEVVGRVPAAVDGRPVRVLVVDDGSTDATAARAAAAGAHVIEVRPNRGLGAAVRRGLAEAVALNPAAVVYIDSDGEYAPEDIPAVVAPVLRGEADYVVGSRFAGEIRTMQRRRRLGNHVLTRLVRYAARRRITDGQSGLRAFSPGAAAAAEVIHDYNYAQVLTLDLLGKGFRYAEVPIRYSFRETGSSFIKLTQYLRRVLPGVLHELNAPSVVGDVRSEATTPSVLDDVRSEAATRG